jgi:N-acetylglucosamine-6-sulfatase
MKRLSMVAAISVALLAVGCAAQAQEAPEDPNVLFVLTDDQDAASLKHMPHVNNLVKSRGTTFENALFSFPLCCPSRATMLTGLYAHNHDVTSNLGPDGGEPRFRELGRDESTGATWLDAAGYRTAYFGKYLNDYAGFYVPPGWDRWYARVGRRADLTFNSDGKKVIAKGSTTDVATARAAARYLSNTTPSAEPFFAFVSFNAPHYPGVHEPRYDDMFRSVRLPENPNFAEADVSDKPEYVRRQAPLTKEEKTALKQFNQDRLRALQTVDKFVQTTLLELEQAGELENTYVFYWTDNGYHLGNHALDGATGGKMVPYEEDVRFPLLARGPGVPEGAIRSEMVLNTDVAPTLARLAQTAPATGVDGRSFAPLLRGEEPPWRDAVLLEGWRTPGNPTPAYEAVRTPDRLYVEYETGERELYDLRADPYELNNLAGRSPEEAGLSARLEDLRGCAGVSCRVAEDAGP